MKEDQGKIRLFDSLANIDLDIFHSNLISLKVPNVEFDFDECVRLG